MTGSLPDNIRNAFRRFKTDPEYAELIKTSSYAMIVRIAGVVTGFFVTLLTSRYYGADALGLVSICLAVLSFASVFGKIGLDVALMKYVAEYASRKDFNTIKAIYISAMKIIVPLSLLISVVLYFISGNLAESYFHKPYLEPILQINAWLTLPLVLILVNSECIRGLKKIRAYTFFQTVSVSLFAMSTLLVVSNFWKEREVPAFVQFACIGLSGTLSLIMWLYYSRFTSSEAKEKFSSKELIKVSTPMFVTTLMQLLMSWAGTLILAAYNSEADVGIYNALVRISVFPNITILAINSLSMPRFAEAYSAGKYDQLRRHAIESARLIFITALPIFIVLSVCPSSVLSVFGKEFPGHEEALYLLLFGQFFVSVAGLPSQILNMTGKQHVLRNISLISAVFNIAGCLIFTPTMGILGTCIAQVIGMIVWNLLAVYNVKRHFGFYTYAFSK